MNNGWIDGLMDGPGFFMIYYEGMGYWLALPPGSCTSTASGSLLC